MKQEIRECVTCGARYTDSEADEFKDICPNCGSTNTVAMLAGEGKPLDVCKKELADRFNAGKTQWSMVDFKSMEDMVRVLEFGVNKYSRDNWKKGLKTTEIVDSMLRHIYAYLDGEDVDPESGINHTGHIMCNAMFLSHMHLFRKDMDTRCRTSLKE